MDLSPSPNDPPERLATWRLAARLWWRDPPTLQSVALGAAGALASLALRLLLRPALGEGEPLLAIFPTVLIVGMIGGARAGWTCLILGLTGAWYLFMGAPFSFSLVPHEASGLFLSAVLGAVVIGICVALRASMSALEAARAREALFARELQHRVKNTLMLVASISRRTYLSDRPLKASQEEFEARLSAIAEAHESIGRTESEDSAQLSELVASTLRPFGYPDAGRFDVEGPKVELSPRAAVALALALHELATNAAKYGALSAPAGEVSIRWTPAADGALQLDWNEQGGPEVDPPSRRGFGSDLIERNVASELRGRARLSYNRGGLSAQIIAREGVELAAP